MDSFAFNPATGFNDTSTFTDPSNETETRSQLMQPHEQTRDYINNTLVAQINTNIGDIEALQTAVLALQGATGDAAAIQQIQNAIGQIQTFLNNVNTLAYVGTE